MIYMCKCQCLTIILNVDCVIGIEGAKAFAETLPFSSIERLTLIGTIKDMSIFINCTSTLSIASDDCIFSHAWSHNSDDGIKSFTTDDIASIFLCSSLQFLDLRETVPE